MKRRIHVFDKYIVLNPNRYFKIFQTGNIVVIYKTRWNSEVFYFSSLRDFLNWRDEVFNPDCSCFDNMISFVVLDRNSHRVQSFDLYYGAFEEYYCNYSCDKAYKDYWHKAFKNIR